MYTNLWGKFFANIDPDVVQYINILQSSINTTTCEHKCSEQRMQCTQATVWGSVQSLKTKDNHKFTFTRVRYPLLTSYYCYFFSVLYAHKILVWSCLQFLYHTGVWEQNTKVYDQTSELHLKFNLVRLKTGGVLLRFAKMDYPANRREEVIFVFCFGQSMCLVFFFLVLFFLFASICFGQYCPKLRDIVFVVWSASVKWSVECESKPNQMKVRHFSAFSAH